ncbi:uncharacterized protein LOC134234504, partial [Saccostrea cucullata]|uniref:uncharacterized protein LOC134234504 n=1 Tax=Saccostrea cuccullata TaxID=36930 RepID=UPI002ED26890
MSPKTTYTEALKTLKTQIMDPQQTEHYLYLREEVADVTYRQREHDRRIADIEVEQEETNKLLKRISSCLGDEHFTAEGIYVLVSTVTVLKDRRFWKTYIRTSAVSGAIQKLMEHKVIILTGDKVGIGKSTTGKQILRELSSESVRSPRIPALIHNPEEWNKVINPKGPYIVFLDDFLGVSNFVIEAADNWKNYFDIILASAREGNVFVVVALRKHILNGARQYFTQAELFSHQFEINLSEEFQLTLEEKQKILESFEQNFKYRAAEIFGPKCKDLESNYNPDDFVILSEMQKNDIVRSDPYYGFPVTCFQFFTRPKCFKQGPKFFCRPTKPLLSEIESKRKSQSFREQVDYCILSYVLVNGSIHSDNIDKNLFQTISSKLMLSNVTDINIADAIEDLSGSLLNKVGESTVFKFAHETILETVLVSFGKLAPDIVIKKCHQRKIQELIRTQNCEVKENEIVLRIPRKNYEDLANRMVRGDDGDGVDSGTHETAMHIIYHTSSCDTEFVAILLSREPDERFLSILSQIFANLPCASVHSKKEPAAVLLYEMLKRFGPHHETLITNQFQQNVMPHYQITFEDIQYFLRNCLKMKHQTENLVLLIVQYLMDEKFLQCVFEENCSFSGRSLTFAQCCILKGWETTVEMVLKLQSSLNAENGWSFTHLAAFAGRWKLLKKFVSDEMSVLEMPEQSFTVVQAALFGISVDKDIAFHRNHTEIPSTLHLAVYLGRPNMVKKMWEL